MPPIVRDIRKGVPRGDPTRGGTSSRGTPLRISAREALRRSPSQALGSPGFTSGSLSGGTSGGALAVPLVVPLEMLQALLRDFFYRRPFSEHMPYGGTVLCMLIILLVITKTNHMFG